MNDIKTADFADEVLKSEKIVIVDFWAEWCGPCRMVSPIVEQFGQENPEIKVVKVNVDEEPELATAYGIRSIPTFLFFKEGQVVNKQIGAVQKSVLVDMLKKIV